MLNTIVAMMILASATPSAAATTNLIPNPSFEAGAWVADPLATGWPLDPQASAQLTGGQHHTGKRSLAVEAFGGEVEMLAASGVSKRVAVTPGNYSLSMALAGVSAAEGRFHIYGVRSFDTAGSLIYDWHSKHTGTSGGQWQVDSVPVELPAGTASAEVYFHVIQARPGCGVSYLDSFGLVPVLSND